jgi:hypothetical protein
MEEYSSPSSLSLSITAEKREAAVRYELTHAKCDPAHCNCPGLFRTFEKGKRDTMPLDIKYGIQDDKTLWFVGRWQLGRDDLRVLQGLVAMAGLHGVCLLNEPTSDIGQATRKLLVENLNDEPSAIATDKAGMYVTCSSRQLAKEIGYANIDGRKTKELIRESLRRLMSVSVFVLSGEKDCEEGYHILSYYQSDETAMHIGLNPRLAEAILGKQHFHVEMSEVRALMKASDAAALIHHRLHWINQGATKSISLDSLCRYAYPDDDAPPKKSGVDDLRKWRARVRQHRVTVHKALKELWDLAGWKFVEPNPGSGKYQVTRPKGLTG